MAGPTGSRRNAPGNGGASRRYAGRRIVALYVLFLQCACGVPRACKSDRISVLPLEDPSDVLAEISEELAVDLFLDATLSMRGFILPEAESRYEQTLQLLERAAQTGWKEAHLTVYRFGSAIEPIGSSAYLAAGRPKFYEDPRFFERTLIERVITFPEDSTSNGAPTSGIADRLKVIVTDLFQNDGDVSLLTRNMKEKYLEKNLAVGVLGIKSEFDGKVYDVGTGNYNFEYKSGDAEERFRPFYVLVLGKHLDVEHFYESLVKSGLDDFPAKEFVIFSRYLARRLASFEESRIVSTEKIMGVQGLLRPGPRTGRMKQLRLSDREATASLEAKLRSSLMKHVVGAQSGPLEPKITAWKVRDDRLEESDVAGRAFSVERSELEKDGLGIKVKLSSLGLPGDGVYCFKIVLRPRGYEMPGWVSAWDMPRREIEKWRQRPADFGGGTTYNLEPFLTDLWDTIVRLHSPKLGELYCYVQRGTR